MNARSNRFAVVMGTDGDSVQRLLTAVAEDCRSAGARVVGLVAEAHGLPDRTCGAGVLVDVISGERHPIYLETPPADTTCHLDAGGVEAACSSVLPLVGDSDLVVLSKFGKLEALGGGLFPVFEAAATAGKPVLTTVSARHREAWKAFAPDAVPIEADETALNRWWRVAVEAHS